MKKMYSTSGAPLWTYDERRQVLSHIRNRAANGRTYDEHGGRYFAFREAQAATIPSDRHKEFLYSEMYSFLHSTPTVRIMREIGLVWDGCFKVVDAEKHSSAQPKWTCSDGKIHIANPCKLSRKEVGKMYNNLITFERCSIIQEEGAKKREYMGKVGQTISAMDKQLSDRLKDLNPISL